MVQNLHCYVKIADYGMNISNNIGHVNLKIDAHNLKRSNVLEVEEVKSKQELNSPSVSGILNTLTPQKNNSANIVFETRNIPNWVDPSYGYDPENPRKPNVRELMRALTGKSVEEIHKNSESEYNKHARRSSEILYEVLGSDADKRDWESIMSSDDVLKAARTATGEMFEPTINIRSRVDDYGTVIDQVAVITDKSGKTLRQVPNNLAEAEETLNNFGVTKVDITKTMEARIHPSKFDKNLLTFLKNFEPKTGSIQHELILSATDALAQRASKEVFLAEHDKL